MTTAPMLGHAPAAQMSRREVLVSISGIMLGMLTTILSSTVVGTSLPVIVHALGGSQSAYTWVVTASLLAMTVSTPIWGKLADLFDRKLLVQLALGVFIASSMLAGLSQETWHLITMRAFQGVGAGGMMSLSMVLIADIISPRERGRYVGVLAGVMSIGTLGGPLLGGVITDLAGWRWNFYVGVPLALAAFLVLRRTLHLPHRDRRTVQIDYLGAALIAAGVSMLLIWVSLAGHEFGWASVQTAALVAGGVLLLGLAVRVEARAGEPVIPLSLFRNRTIVLTTIASVTVGMGMFGAVIFLAQYMQIARGQTPTESGLLTIPLMLGSLVASTVTGSLVTRTGRYKPFMLGGTISLTAGLALLATIDQDTSFVVLGVYQALVGLGMGACMQNLVLATQNSADIRQLGVATATITFFRTLGGAVGVAVLGAVLGSRVASMMADGLAALGVDSGAALGGSIPDPSTLPGPVRDVVEQSYAQGMADLFLAAVPFGVIAVVAVALMPEQPLGTKSGIEEMAAVSGEQPAPGRRP